jgi:hypothetical protein
MIKVSHVPGRAFVFEREPKWTDKVFSSLMRAGQVMLTALLCGITAYGNSPYVREKGGVVPWMIYIFLFVVTHQSFE